VTPLSLGIFASANTTVGTSFESIATVTVGSGGASNVEFTSIPGTYTHLQIRGISKATNNPSATDWNLLYIETNSDTGSNYSEHRIEGNGSSVSATGSANTTKMAVSVESGSLQNANTFGVAVIDVLDYANTNKYKTFRGLGGADNNGSGVVSFHSGLWRSTNAITSIKLTPQASTFAQYTQFALYGIKSA
jgi:hypothetical protein